LNRPFQAHVWSLLAALVVVIAVSAAWLAWYKTFPRGTGFDDLTGIVVPFGLLILVGLWLVIRALAHGRVVWGLATVVGAALALTYVLTAIYCGPLACFTPGPSRLMGWFLVGGAVLAALAHHLVLTGVSRRANPA
jgi:hypothetical protein